MSLTAVARWKEEIVVTDESDRTFVFQCAWGISPPEVYVPSVSEWTRCLPEWLWHRRDEVIAALRATGNVVLDGRYPALLTPR